MLQQSSRIAVIGAGIAGLSAAQSLAKRGHGVTVFEKSRAPGGRAATRRVASWRFDHGAQYFTLRDPRTHELAERWQADGLIARWRARVAVREHSHWREAGDDVVRWVAVPSMRALGEQLARGLELQFETTVGAIERIPVGWRVLGSDGRGLGEYRYVLVTAPAPQTAVLLAPHAPSFSAQLGTVPMRPCIAAMVVLSRRPNVAWDAAFVNDDDVLSWVSRNASKPGRASDECWVLHATPEWSARHLEQEPATLLPSLLDAFRTLLASADRGADSAHTPVVEHAIAHRWRYAIPEAAPPMADGEALFDAAAGLGAAGDWCVGGRVEGAVVSGMALADLVDAALRR